VTLTLSDQLRRLASRLSDDDGCLVWRAANQLEALQAGIGEAVESDETLKQARDRGEKTRLLAVLLHVGGNRTWAANRLRISRTALQKVLRKHRLKPPIAR